ncbi:MAG: 3-phosphoshikimate 1-carboxyvinyltransferase [Gemmatimonadaceae bacterium]
MAALTVAGTVRVPGDKSISHRALILSALSKGDCRIRGILDSADVRSTAGALAMLGVRVPPLSDDLTVSGRGLRGLVSPREPLHCGNSGTTTRLLAGVIAAHPFSARFEGDASLSRRPMRRIAEPLTSMGATFEFEHGDGLPMTIHGVDLRSVDWDTGGSSAQVKSAILLAGLVAGVEVRVIEKSLSRDHTEKMMRAMGVDVENDGKQVCLRASHALSATDFDIPADPSSAAFFLAMSTMADEGELVLPDVCLNPTRTGFIAAMKKMGADISVTQVSQNGGEDRGTLRVKPAHLRGLHVGSEDIAAVIDELPLLACVAAGAGVDLQITGAEELRVKESDRIRVVVDNLGAVGAEVEELPDGLFVRGVRKDLAGIVDSHGDHRIAMAFGVLAKRFGGKITVKGRDSVDVSYPGFWKDLEEVAA